MGKEIKEEETKGDKQEDKRIRKTDTEGVKEMQLKDLGAKIKDATEKEIVPFLKPEEGNIEDTVKRKLRYLLRGSNEKTNS